MTVREQLDSLDGEIKVLHKGDYTLIQCPYHKDGQETHPSLMVNTTNPRYEEGFFYCLSCGEKGGWNKLAETLDLEANQSGQQAKKNPLNSFTLSMPKLEDNSPLESSWPVKREWRGIEGKLLHSLDATLKFNSFTNQQHLVLPVKILNKVVGTITCRLEKDSKDNSPSYINSPGPWVKKSVFPYDSALMLQRSTLGSRLPLFIVEGPRDALNLIQLGLPAVSILGSFNWDKELSIILAPFNPSYYVVMMDADEAGEKASNVVYSDLIKYFGLDRVRVCKLPTGKDPANLDTSHAKKLKLLYSKPN